MPASRPLSPGWGRRREREHGNLRRISKAALMRRFFLAFIHSFKAKLDSHGFLLDQVEIRRLIIARKFHKLNSRRHGMFSWINVRPEEVVCQGPLGSAPALGRCWGWHHRDTNDVLIQCSRVTESERGNQYAPPQNVDLETLRGWSGGSTSRRPKGGFKTTTLH